MGTNNDQNNAFRSPNGFLRGWAADEAIASAVYLFARNKNNIQKAMYEGVNTPGDSDSIATLAGALIGAYSGNLYMDKNLDLLEKRKILEKRALEITNSISQ